ncbi:MAG: hypothetical protein K8T91_17345 [Planctomycetes bacterium]|nr:hypothetical protein [Planctomycetota bacterium]
MNVRNPQGRTAFTLVELLVVVAVIVILFALLMPAIGAARQSSRTTKCAHHLSEFHVALRRVSLKAPLTNANGWPAALSPYIDQAGTLLRCPDDVTSSSLPSYGLSTRAFRMLGGDDHKLVMLDYHKVVADVVGRIAPDPAQWGLGTTIAQRHRQQANVLTFGGTVQLRSVAALDPQDCDIHDRLWRPVRDSAYQWDRPNCAKELPLTPSTSTGGGTTSSYAPCPGLTGTTLTISALNASVDEPDQGQQTLVQMQITLSAAASQAVTVTALTSDGGANPASAGVDYTAVNQLITFNPGETTKNVTVTVIGDNTQEPNETTFLQLTYPRFNGMACQELSASTAATLTIHDNDAPPPGQPADPCKPQGYTQQVDKGLNWLARHQFNDGSWSLKHSQTAGCNCPNDGSPHESRIAATAVALLPLIGAGNAPGSNAPYADNVCRGLQYLMARQNVANGSLAEVTDTIANRVMYSHHFATVALTEGLLAMQARQAQGCAGGGGTSTTSGTTSTTTGGSPAGCTIDINLLQARANQAAQYTINQHMPVAGADQRGGWCYFTNNNSPQPWGELSMSTWAMLGLNNARRAGLSVPQPIFDTLRNTFFPTIRTNPITDQGWTLGDYRYQARLGNGRWSIATESMTACGLYVNMMLGAPSSHTKIQSFANQPALVPWVGDPMYNFHMTHFMHLAGGQPWETWKGSIEAMASGQQAQGGHIDGSWYWGSCPQEPRAATAWNPVGGRHYCTTFSLLCLQEYFNRLRISQ